MGYQSFLIWLREEKNMSERSARDVVSRLKRAIILLESEDINEGSIERLGNTPAFSECTTCIKSQLKRSVSLYQEFSEKN